MKSNPGSKPQSSVVISDELAEKALRRLEQCLDAKMVVRVGRGKDGLSYEAIPNYPIVFQAAVKVLEFRHGKPATTLFLTPPGPTGPRLEERPWQEVIAANPEIAEKVFAQLAERARALIPLSADGSPTPAKGS